MSAYDLGSPTGEIVDMSEDPEGYKDWVAETYSGVAIECGARALRKACEDPELSDLIVSSAGEGCL